MEEKLSGIVLGGVNVSENDKILSIFTLEQGTVSAKIKGVKKAGAKLKFASEPFCFAEFIFLDKNGFKTVINASLIDSFYPVREDIKKYYAGAVVLEFIKKFAKENIVSHELFMLALSTLKEIAYGEDYIFPTVIFLTEGLSLAGYALTFPENIDDKVYFDYRTGTFYSTPEGRAREIKKETFSALFYTKRGEKKGNAVNALKLLDYYTEKKTEEKINSLKELIKITDLS